MNRSDIRQCDLTTLLFFSESRIHLTHSPEFSCVSNVFPRKAALISALSDALIARNAHFREIISMTHFFTRRSVLGHAAASLALISQPLNASVRPQTQPVKLIFSRHEDDSTLRITRWIQDATVDRLTIQPSYKPGGSGLQALREITTGRDPVHRLLVADNGLVALTDKADLAREFSALAPIASQPAADMALFASYRKPITRFEDYREWAQDRPNLKLGGLGTGLAPARLAAALDRETKTLHQYVPSNSARKLGEMLRCGHLDAIVGTAEEHEASIASGLLRPLLRFTDRPSPTLGQVPTASELCMPIRYDDTTNFFAASNVPENIIAVLRSALASPAQAG
ncbi:MAG: hypothetical protein HKP40_01995 [Litoreibacter sp.]|nr:hypothetical protein [Litoreibacter sp.]